MATVLISFKNRSNGSVMSFDSERLIKIDGKTIGKFKNSDINYLYQIGKSGFRLNPDEIKSRDLKMVFKEREFKILKYNNFIGAVCITGSYLPTKFNKELREKFFNGTKY